MFLLQSLEMGVLDLQRKETELRSQQSRVDAQQGRRPWSFVPWEQRTNRWGTLCKVDGCLTTMLHTRYQYKVILNVNYNFKDFKSQKK